MARIFPMSVGTTQVKNFTSNQTFPMPAGVTSITVTGKGASGSPASSGSVTYLDNSKIVALVYPDGSLHDIEETFISRAIYSGQSYPSDYCTDAPYTSIGTPTGTKRRTCYYWKRVTEAYDRPATTGASASGFNKTFPGGYAGPATPVTYENVAVIPGNPYPVVVPSGGSITITYIA